MVLVVFSEKERGGKFANSKARDLFTVGLVGLSYRRKRGRSSR